MKARVVHGPSSALRAPSPRCGAEKGDWFSVLVMQRSRRERSPFVDRCLPLFDLQLSLNAESGANATAVRCSRNATVNSLAPLPACGERVPKAREGHSRKDEA